MLELKCTVQNYAWGKKGSKSSIAKLLTVSDQQFQVDENENYAELWMGTHSSGPSFIKSTGQSLEHYLNENKSKLGDDVYNTFGQSLPFLFKILSVGKALSIQAHPDKKLARNLNKVHPHIYKDPNHKPELSIALTPFQALCGFRPINVIKEFLSDISELRFVIGEEITNSFLQSDDGNAKTWLQRCFEELLTHHADSTSEQLYNFRERLSQMDKHNRDRLHGNLFEKLYTDFPGDIGCFGIYFFNYISLAPGEAIFIAANEPHAYLSGDCIECMACSDNVVRAGLTPKYKDIPTLISMLTYKCEPPNSKIFKGTYLDEFTQIFRPPIEDFAVSKIEIPSGVSSYQLLTVNSAAILVIIHGTVEIDSHVYTKGSVIFIPANENISMKIVNQKDGVLMFEAFANV